MTNPQTTNAPLRLAQYLKEFVGLRTTTVRDVTKYDAVVWFGDMPQEKDCFCPAWVDGCEPGEPWLEVKKQHFETMPKPPDTIQQWIDERALKRATEQMPALKVSILMPDELAQLDEGESAPLIEVSLSNYPEVVSAYDRYRPSWQAWSDEYRRRQEIQNLYAKLFSLHTQLRKQGELLELVIGLGLLDWRAPIGGKVIPIRRHMIAARVELAFEPDKGVMRLVPPGDGARLQIEDDMLEVELRPDRSQYQAVKLQLDHIGDEIWDKSLMPTALKHWAGALNADSLWSADLRSHAGDQKKPVVSFAPALILRKRTQTGMVRIYEALIDQLSDESAKVPEGWGGLIDDVDDLTGDGSSENGERRLVTPTGIDNDQIYFPLPANKEQRRIVQAIDRQRGVLVQGPPGTGKSHTIANLICHLLATGKRVLITAETGRALQVLKSKLPEEIQPLCVSLLGQGGDAFAELNTAVQGITTRQAAYSPGAYQSHVAEIDAELDQKRRQLAQVDNEIRSLREEETCPHQLADGAYHGTASFIAERVAREAANYNWLELPYDATGQPPVNGEELQEWLTLLSSYSPEKIADAQLQFPSTTELAEPTNFSSAVANEASTIADLQMLKDLLGHPAYTAIRALKSESRSSLYASLRQCEEERLSIMRITSVWAKDALRDVVSGRRARWKTVLDRTHALSTEAEPLCNGLGNVVVRIPDDQDPRKVRADAQAAIAYLNAGGAWKRMGMFTPTELKGKSYLKDDVLVDGAGAATQEQLQCLCNELSTRFLLDEIKSVWAAVGGSVSAQNRSLFLADVREQHSQLRRCIAYGDACQQVGLSMSGCSPPIPEPDWLNGETAKWIELIDAATKEDDFHKARSAVMSCATALFRIASLHNAHPQVSAMIAAVEQRNIGAYSQCYAALQTLEQIRASQIRRSAIEHRLGEQAPDLVTAVLDGTDGTHWHQRFSAWEAAWHWAVADNWLEKRADPTFQQKLLRRRHDIATSIEQLVAEAAGFRAWTHFFNRLNSKESAALKSWREAVKAMGKGTGKSAKMARLRQEARMYMDACRDAIPIWVMPRYLVAEMIDPAPGRFDLVIVDEASQLGIDSLFLFYVSKKMVVVGDDQQISPYGIGIADDAVAGLQAHYLEGIPHRHALSPQSSLYGNAKIRFSQNIVLREHFRCMPEIIQFSNDLCYASNGTPLDPLRAYPANRLQPLVLRHVEHGYRTGSSQHAQNIPEADAIVAQIAGCIADPRYRGKTFGVISLQGEAQAKLIEKKLLEQLEPEEIEERQLICGDAYAFQGDERHVIFLSMVAAPGDARIGALTTDSARQRFNVAVSRAQDQLWLFHTATLDVLSDLCMRYRLLKYMLEPKRETTSEQAQRFDSAFERAIYQRITERGFSVRTQVCIGDPTNHRYRIDLVVEGMQGRLAVECDGDQWHGPDRYEHDMARQRDLERAGWQFVRIRGGDFYRNPEIAMQPVWDELERLGIKPGGLDTSAAAPPAPIDFDTGQVGGLLQGEGNNEPASISGDAEVTDVTPIPPTQSNDETQESDATELPESELDTASQDHSSNELDGISGSTPTQPDFLETGSRRTSIEPDRSAYVEFRGSIIKDPRNSDVDTSQVAEGLLRIIDAEAPILAKRAYDIYLRNCGIHRWGGELRKTMNKALQHLINIGRVVKEDEHDSGGLLYTIVRPKGTLPVKVRCRGSRDFSEIPPSEIFVVATLIADKEGYEIGSDAHLRAVLDSFDLTRLTVHVGSALLEILKRKYPYV
jgi:very-short-patch-repair endonuclease